MRLYDYTGAPSARRVRVFLAEKGLTVPRVNVDLRQREQFAADFKARNPACTVPALELDDGTVIGESMAICRYFEELCPEPALFGRTPKERALVEMWSRRAELDGYLRVADVLRNSSPVFAGRGLAGAADGVPQIPALVERGRAGYARFIDVLDAALAARPFVALADFTVADITAFVTVDFATRVGLGVPPDARHARRWFDAVAKRPSAAA